MGHIGCCYPRCCCYSQIAAPTGKMQGEWERGRGRRRGSKICGRSRCPCRPLWQVACAAPWPQSEPGSGSALPCLVCRCFVRCCRLLLFFNKLVILLNYSSSRQSLSPLPLALPLSRNRTPFHMRLVWLYWPKQPASSSRRGLCPCVSRRRLSFSPCPLCHAPYSLAALSSFAAYNKFSSLNSFIARDWRWLQVQLEVGSAKKYK